LIGGRSILKRGHGRAQDSGAELPSALAGDTVELVEGDIDRARTWTSAYSAGWQHLDELGVLVDEALELWQLDSRGHGWFS
jgi:hypothetical protein